jgi:peptidoglycan/LPS O-acetylase OafA/YrhL
MRRPDVQGLRAIAVILVVLYHSDLPVPGGFVGVDVFFVISGYVITRMLWRELQATGRIDLRAFYARRVRRLLPALALVLVFVALVSLVLQSPLGQQQQTAKTGAAAALFVANASLFLDPSGYFALPASTYPLLHTWTLAVEEQFYVFFPALLLVGWRLGAANRTRTVSIMVGAVLVLSLAAGLFLAQSSNLPFQSLARNQSFAFYASPVRAWEFSIGSLLAIWEPRLVGMGRWAALAAGIAGAGMIVGAALVIGPGGNLPAASPLVADAGAALLIAAGMTAAAGVPSLLSIAPMVWIGDTSYGWYLWHWPLIVFTRTLWPAAPPVALLAAATLGLLPTWLSYRWLENPIRFNRAMVGRRAVALGVICASVPLAVNGALWATTRVPFGPVPALALGAQGHADSVRHCTANLPTDSRTKTSCTWTTAGAQGTVYLIGDSNAGQFAEPVAAAARARGFSMTLATYGGCPFADVITHYDDGHVDEVACRAFVLKWVDYLERSRPAMVFLASAAANYVNQGNGVTFTSPEGGAGVATRSGKTQLWEQGLRSVLVGLSQSGVPTVVIHTVPQFGGFNLRTCPAYLVYTDHFACGQTASRASVEAFQQFADTAEIQALAGLPLAAGVDFTNEICSPSECSTNRGDLWLYRDGAHLSVPGSLLLEPHFATLIGDQARKGSP